LVLWFRFLTRTHYESILIALFLLNLICCFAPLYPFNFTMIK